MKLIRIGAAALNQTPLDWDVNAANMSAAIMEAKRRNVDVLCLPELCVSGYGCEDAFHAPSLRRMARRVITELLPNTQGLAVTFGFPVLVSGSLYNACALAVNGALVGIVPKQHLAGDGLHYEPRWFKPWSCGRAETFDFDGRNVPIGDIVFDLDGIRVGFEICEDAWVANRPGIRLAERHVDIILNPSASHFAFGKDAVRQRFVAEGSRAFGVTYVYSNLVGNEAGRAVYDGGAMVTSQGNLVAKGPRFSFKPWQITDAVVDIDATRMLRSQVASRPHVEPEDKSVVHVPFVWTACDSRAEGKANEAFMPASKENEFTHAIALALYDYARKSRSQGFVVSLSGGADSAAVACLVRLAVELGIGELGADAFCQGISIPQPGDCASHEEIDVSVRAVTHALLTTVYQSTRNSSSETREAAQTVADAIGACHLELDVDDLVAGYVERVSKALDRTLSWERDDIALQNIQARVRAPGVWMIANVKNALLLATSNRSEAAVGYATMDGDTCGGISPIAGIDKAFLRQWLRWLEVEGPKGVGPIPELKCVNQQQPTAELRPQDQHQTDEDDLMPYDVLDAIEDEAIGQRRSPAEVLGSLPSQFPDCAHKDLERWVTRFFTLWCRNQWKRERYAPAFHVDDKNLDPKTWCRFPILSGGFRRELRELSE